MSEGIALPRVARGTLLAESARLARLDEALPQIRAALEGETDAVAIEATLACLLWEALVQTNWCGFYRRTADRLLTVGPYQGTMGCLRIDFARGVCGACARTGEDVMTMPAMIGASASSATIAARAPRPRGPIFCRSVAGTLRQAPSGRRKIR